MTELLSVRLLGGKYLISEPLGRALRCVFLEAGIEFLKVFTYVGLDDGVAVGTSSWR